jgi:hypothetical protein
LYWRGHIWPDQCAPFGLATGNIQGELADATVDILAAHNIPHVVKWVDNFDFLCHSVASSFAPDGSTVYSYSFDLDTILHITRPLGIPWHDVSEQGHNFAYHTEYSGFTWDLPNKWVSLSNKKRLKYLNKVVDFLNSSTVTEKEVTSIHGTLQHITFVYSNGCAYLPALSHIITHFPNKWARHHTSPAVCKDMLWWKETLPLHSVSHSLLPHLQASYDIWVDASTLWGIGILIDQRWMAWKLTDGWNTDR